MALLFKIIYYLQLAIFLILITALLWISGDLRRLFVKEEPMWFHHTVGTRIEEH